MRIALVYDCLYPHTVGGAERWLRAAGEALAHEHEVTYLTRRQWAEGELDAPHGVRCLAVAPGGPLYTEKGRRRLLPALVFAAGVFWHLARRRGDYDVVHCLSYPYLSVLAARLALLRSRARLWVEWLECLSPSWWRRYAGRAGGRAGVLLQRACVRATPRAFAFSGHTERRLREEGFRGELIVLGGLANEDHRRPPPTERDPELVVFAGRHVPDKGAALLPRTLWLVRQKRPAVRAVIAGDGPERGRVAAEVAALGLGEAVDMPGFLSPDQLARLLERAACVVAPSRRDGFGMVVAEAAAAGTPVAVCKAPDNAAAERVEEGVNGSIAPAATAEHLAAAIERALAGGEELRRSTRGWYERNAEGLSMRRSVERLCEVYRDGRTNRPTRNAAWRGSTRQAKAASRGGSG